MSTLHAQSLAFFSELPNHDFASLEVVLAMLESLVLNLIVAQIYKKTHKGPGYSQDYVHTLIIIGTVTTALILVIAGNSAIAFGMFAAFSLIRFRRNLFQARDLAFIFYAMATGMIVGARHYEIAAIIVALLAVAVLCLARFDAFSSKQDTHTLRLRVTRDTDYQVEFETLFGQFLLSHEMEKIESVQAGTLLELTYTVVTKPKSSSSDFLKALQVCNGNNWISLTKQQ